MMINPSSALFPDRGFEHVADSCTSSRVHLRRGGVRGEKEFGDTIGRVRDERGDTLIEILLSLIILGLASLAMIVAFGTSLTASGQHRNLTTAETYAKTVANHVVSSVQALSGNFSCATPPSKTTYSGYITSNGVTPPTGYSATVSSLQFWDKTTSSWSSACIANAAQFILVTVTSASGATNTVSVVVVNPGAATVVVSNTATQLVFTAQPGPGAVNSPLSVQPQVAYEDSNNAIATNYLASNPVTITAFPVQPIQGTNNWSVSGPGFAPSNCASQASNGYVSFTGCEIDTVGHYELQATDGKFTTGYSTMFTVNKGANVITLTSTPTSPVIFPGSLPYQATATALGGTVVITSATPGVCTVSSSGAVSYIGAGVCAINFSDSGDASWNAAPTLAQGIVVYLANTITVGPAPTAAVVNGPTYTPSASATSGATAPSGALGTIVVSSTTPGVCTVSSPADVVSFIGVGTCSLSFSDVGNQTYVSTSKIQSFQVGPGANVITVDPAPTTAVYGTTYTPKASATSGATAPTGALGTIVVTSATPNDCSVSSGVVTFIRVGVANCTLNFNDAGNPNYVAATQVQQTISVTPAPLTVNVSGTQIYGRSPVFTPTFIGWVNGDNSGVITGTLTCTTTATATSSPASGFTVSSCTGLSAANYTLTYAYGSLSVVKATPTITWNNPATMTYGTLLSNAQLNATASNAGAPVSGTMLYSPGVGVKLPTGSTTLNVSFTPTDVTDYTSPVTASVTVVVNLASQNLTISPPTSSLLWSTTTTVKASGQGTGAVSYYVDSKNSIFANGSCSVDQQSGVVSATGAGTCSVYATIAADTTFAAATSPDATVTFNRIPRTLTVFGSPASPTWTTPLTLGYAPSNGTGVVSYQVVWPSSASLTDLSVAANNPAFIPSGATGVSLGATGPPSIGGGAVAFSGQSGSYLETSQPFNTVGAGSISIWFNTTASGSIMGASSCQTDATPNNWDRMLWIDGTGHLVGGIYDYKKDEVTSPAVVSDGKWHLATLTWGTSNGETLYLDGVQVAQNAYSTLVQNSNGSVAQNFGGDSNCGTGSGTGAGTGYWHIGYNTTNSWPNGSTSYYFTGSLSHAAAYPSELTATQVRSLFAPPPPASEDSTTLALNPTSYWPLDNTRCTLNSAQQLVALSPGMCYFSGTITADANYLAATSPVVSAQFTLASPGFTAKATAISSCNQNGNNCQTTGYQITSSANALDTGAVNYQFGQNSSGSCSLDSQNVLTANSGRTCYVTATIAPDALFLGATYSLPGLTFPGGNN